MTDEHWSTNPSNYELIGKIGQGAFASVWRGKTKSDQECAVKVLNLDHVDSNLSEIRMEVQAMRLSSHRNILVCHCSFVRDTNLWLVTQLMRKGSSLHCLQTARQIMRQNNQRPAMEDHIIYILRETLLGLQYIHDNGQIHRDVKAGNILLDGNGDVRIADFGVSGWLVNAGSEQEKAKTFVGTPCWMAPEVMEQIHGYDYKADIWSLGITAMELAKGYAPYAKYPPMKVLILTIQQEPPCLDTYEVEDDSGLAEVDANDDEEWSETFRSLVKVCVQKNPARRPSCLDLLRSKPFDVINDPSHREQRIEAMQAQVCNLVQDVGSGSATAAAHSNLPGNSPVSIILSTEDDRPPGTTWVFADGSQVLASGSTTHATVDDVMDQLDQFGRQTGGENYDASRPQPQAVTHNPKNNTNNTEEDDLNDFMDEFELNTAGEDFRHPSDGMK